MSKVITSRTFKVTYLVTSTHSTGTELFTVPSDEQPDHRAMTITLAGRNRTTPDNVQILKTSLYRVSLRDE